MINYLFDLVRSGADNNSYNTDSVDKCNSRYCAIVLLVLATFVMTNQLVGDVIDCWTDAQYSGQWVRYTDQMCWVSNTYHLPEDITPEEGRDSDHMYEIKYYQWVPVILAVQALLFFLPSLLWSAVADSSIDISNIASALNDKGLVVDPEKRDTSVKNVALQFHRYIKNRRQYSKTQLSEMRRKLRETNSFCLTCGSRYGNYLGLFYLLTKALFVFNAWTQLFCLDSFLGPKFHAYGFDVLQSMYDGVDWTNSRRFPRVTLCDFTIRKMGVMQPVTVQCVLSINLFNERIFLFVWFMLLLMALTNTANFALWMWRIVLRRNRYEYIRKHLTLMDKLNSNKNISVLSQFVDRYLQHDGAFVIRLMSKNATSLVISEMVAALFDNYLENGVKASDEDSLPSTSPRGSSFGLLSRKGTLQKLVPRKRSMPPSYGSGGFRNGFHARLTEGLMDELDDNHSADSSEGANLFHRGSLPNSDLVITPDELAYIRRLMRSERGSNSRMHPSAPHPATVANTYSAMPTIPSGPYPHFHDETSFDPDLHPKAREASHS